MSDESTSSQIDQDHPWVHAAMTVPLQPTPSSVNLDDVELTIEGRKVKAALLTVADPSGVRTAFLPPSLLAEMIAQGLEILDEWEKEKETGLVVANSNTNVRNLADAMNKIKGER